MANKNIGALPAVTEAYDESMLVMEQEGVAVKLTMAQLKAYIEDAAREAALGLARDGGTLTLNGSPLVIGPDNYGNLLPGTGVEGQIFFLLG